LIDSNQTDYGDTALKIRATIHQAMYSPHGWSTFANTQLVWFWGNLTQIAQSASSGSGSSSSSSQKAALSAMIRRQSDEEAQLENFNNNLLAIKCGDAIDPGNVTTRMVFDEELRVAHEVSGVCTYFLLNVLVRLWLLTIFTVVAPQFPQPAHQCHLWPYRAKERYAGPFNKTLKNPILVVGNTDDPATPFKDAKGVADMLGDSATLVQQNGYGVSSND
jgi:hypothetical protein